MKVMQSYYYVLLKNEGELHEWTWTNLQDTLGKQKEEDT